MFFKTVEKIYVDLYSLLERFNKMEMEIDSENESQLKRIRKPPLLLSQEGSVGEIVKKYPCLSDKSQKRSLPVVSKRHFSKIFLILNLSFFFSRFDSYFSKFKNKITLCQTLRCILISAKSFLRNDFCNDYAV